MLFSFYYYEKRQALIRFVLKHRPDYHY